VTVTANSTSEEKPTTVVDDLETPTVSVDDLEEYKSFVKALDQVDDNQCLDHLIVISLNLFHANEVKPEGATCDNSYSDALNRYRKEKPCSNNRQLQYVADYMDAQIQLLCHSYETGNSDLTDTFVKEKKN